MLTCWHDSYSSRRMSGACTHLSFAMSNVGNSPHVVKLKSNQGCSDMEAMIYAHDLPSVRQRYLKRDLICRVPKTLGILRGSMRVFDSSRKGFCASTKNDAKSCASKPGMQAALMFNADEMHDSARRLKGRKETACTSCAREISLSLSALTLCVRLRCQQACTCFKC